MFFFTLDHGKMQSVFRRCSAGGTSRVSDQAKPMERSFGIWLSLGKQATVAGTTEKQGHISGHCGIVGLRISPEKAVLPPMGCWFSFDTTSSWFLNINMHLAEDLAWTLAPAPWPRTPSGVLVSCGDGRERRFSRQSLLDLSVQSSCIVVRSLNKWAYGG